MQRQSSIRGNLYVDGQAVLTFDPTIASGDLSNSVPLLIGNHPDLSMQSFFKGIIDEFAIYGRALTGTEIQAIYTAGVSGKCWAPAILVQPTNQIALVGDTATFTVVASGVQPLNYQWTFNMTNIYGATNTLLMLTNVQLSQAGNYSVVVANAFGSIQSSNAVRRSMTGCHRSLQHNQRIKQSS